MYKRTYEVININDLKIVSNVNVTTHARYYCPFCRNKRGDAYFSAGKLYYDIKLNVGLCQQCNTVVFPKDSNEIKEDVKELNLAINTTLNTLDTRRIIEISPLKLDFDKVDSNILIYLKKRNPLLINLYKLLNFKKWSGSRLGVIIPFFSGEDVLKIQVRFIDNKLPKYWTAPGVKPFYSPCRLKNNLLENREITLCEGVFDAIALKIMGYSNPIACLGSTLTKYQLFQIRKLLPERCTVIMDKVSLGYNVKTQLRQEVRSLSSCVVDSFGKHDPEEYLVSRLGDDLIFKNICLDNIKAWIKKSH